ncbi:YIP1 family protein, partial [Paludifilum halophilum]
MPYSPWWEIWLQPQRTIREVLEKNSKRSVILLVVLFGIAFCLEQASLRSVGDTVSLPALLVFSLILGPIFGLVGWAIISGLTYWTGSWLGGT